MPEQAIRASVWLACEGRAVARFDFDESLRPDAVATMGGLLSRGLDVVLLSGDHPDRAARLGERLLSQLRKSPDWSAAAERRFQVIGGATPESKLVEIVRAQARGLHVAMVGDGINDAPVLARADVSFAMGQGALIAKAQSDAVVASGRLGDVLLGHQIARKAVGVIRQNLLWAAVYNGACIPLAMMGWLPPWAAGLGMASSSLLVILNSMRLARPLRQAD